MEYIEYLYKNNYAPTKDKEGVQKLRQDYFDKYIAPDVSTIDPAEQKKIANNAVKEFQRQEKEFSKFRNNQFQAYKKSVIANDDVNTVEDLSSKYFRNLPKVFKDDGRKFDDIDHYEQEKKWQKEQKQFQEDLTVASSIKSDAAYEQYYKEELDKLGGYVDTTGTNAPGASMFAKWIVARMNAKQRQAQDYIDFTREKNFGGDLNKEKGDLKFDFFENPDLFLFQRTKESPIVKPILNLIAPNRQKFDMIQAKTMPGEILAGVAGILPELPLFAKGAMIGFGLSKALSQLGDEIEDYNKGREFNTFKIVHEGAKGVALGGLLDLSIAGGDKIFRIAGDKIKSRLWLEGLDGAASKVDKALNVAKNATMPVIDTTALMMGERVLNPDQNLDFTTDEFVHGLGIAAAMRFHGYAKSKLKGMSTDLVAAKKNTYEEFKSIAKIRNLKDSKYPDDIKKSIFDKHIKALEQNGSLKDVSVLSGVEVDSIKKLSNPKEIESFVNKYDDAHANAIVKDVVEAYKNSDNPMKAIDMLAGELGDSIPKDNLRGMIEPYMSIYPKTNAAKEILEFLAGKYEATDTFKKYRGKDKEVYDPQKEGFQLDPLTGRRIPVERGNMPITEIEVDILMNAKELKRSMFKQGLDNPERIIAASGAGMNEMWNAVMNKGLDTIQEINKSTDKAYESFKAGKGLTTEDFIQVGKFMFSRDNIGKELVKKGNNNKTVDSLTPKQKQYFEYINEEMTAIWKDVNVARQLAGKDPISFRDYYLPVVPKKDFLQHIGLKEFGLETRFEDNDTYWKKAKDYAFERTRSKKSADIEFNADVLFKHYVEKSSNTIVKTPIVQKMRDLLYIDQLQTGETLNLRENKPNLFRMLNKTVDAFEGRIDYDADLGVYKFLDYVGSNVGKAYISSNINSFLVQPAAIRGAATDAPGLTMKHAGAVASRAKWKEAFTDSVELRTRLFDSIQNEYGKKIDRKYLNKVTEMLAVGSDGLNNLGFTPMKYLDLATAMTSWHVAKDLGVKKYNLSGKALRDFADKKVRDWNASGKQFDQISIMRHPLGKNFLKFMTFPINDWNFLLREKLGVSPFQKGQENIQDKQFDFDKTKLQRTTGILNYLVMGGIIASAYTAVGLRSPIPDPLGVAAKALLDPKTPQNSLDKAAWEIVEEALSYAPLGSSIRYGQSGLTGAVFDVPMQLAESLAGKRDAKPLIEPLVALMGIGPAKQFLKYYRRKQYELKKLEKQAKKAVREKKKLDRENDPRYLYRKFYREMRQEMYKGLNAKQKAKMEINKSLMKTIMEYKPRR
jgi:hypothetical protein